MKLARTDSIDAWHFAHAAGRLNEAHPRKVEVGKIYDSKGQFDLRGITTLKSSRRAIYALTTALSGPLICRVRVWGEVAELEERPSQHHHFLAGRHLEVMSVMDGSALLHKFACDCADDALRIAKLDDDKARDGIKAKRAWMQGKINDEELKAAHNAIVTYGERAEANALETAHAATSEDPRYAAASAVDTLCVTSAWALGWSNPSKDHRLTETARYRASFDQYIDGAWVEQGDRLEAAISAAEKVPEDVLTLANQRKIATLPRAGH